VAAFEALNTARNAFKTFFGAANLPQAGGDMGKAQKKAPKRTKGRRVPTLPQLRPGMPAPDSVAESTEFTSPQGAKYTILKTTETDAYDPPPPISMARSKRR
jgi:hypothetical protein